MIWNTMSSRAVKFKYLPGEHVFCFEPDPTKARVIYEAKILDTTSYLDAQGKKLPGYHIHFLRWNNSWDRIVGEELVLKNTEEHKLLMKQLSEAARKNQKNSNRRKRINEILTEAFNGSPPVDTSLTFDEDNTTDINDTVNECVADSDSGSSEARNVDKSQKLRPNLDIEIYDSLKTVLDKDYFAINLDKKLVKLPADVNVVTILESFVKTLMMDFWSPNFDRSYICHNPPKIAIERILPMCKEFVDGLRICFDFLLSSLLLYDAENTQYDKLMASYKHKSPAKQKILSADSSLLQSPKLRSTQQTLAEDQPWPKIPKLSPKVIDNNEADYEVPFPSFVPCRMTRSKFTNSSAKPETSKHSEKQKPVNTEKVDKADKHCESDSRLEKENSTREQRKRCSQDKQEDLLRRRALRSFRKTSEDSTESDQSTSDTVMSELARPAHQKSEKYDRPPPLLIPCNLIPSNQNGADKTLKVEAPGSSDSLGDNGREEILSNILSWKLLPEEALIQLPTQPSILYGAQHLLRMFVKLPGLISKMDLDDNRMGVLKKLMQQFLLYLMEHVVELFPDSTYASSADVLKSFQ